MLAAARIALCAATNPSYANTLALCTVLTSVQARWLGCTPNCCGSDMRCCRRKLAMLGMPRPPVHWGMWLNSRDANRTDRSVGRLYCTKLSKRTRHWCTVVSGTSRWHVKYLNTETTTSWAISRRPRIARAHCRHIRSRPRSLRSIRASSDAPHHGTSLAQPQQCWLQYPSIEVHQATQKKYVAILIIIQEVGKQKSFSGT